MSMMSLQTGVRGDPMAGEQALNRLANMQDLVGKNLNNIVGNLWQRQEHDGSGSSHGNMSPRSGVSEPEPESPGDSGTDLRHDSAREFVGHREDEDMRCSDNEQDEAGKIGMIGIRSDLLPTHPLPKEGLTPRDLSGLQGLPALEALRRQAGAQNPFLAGLQTAPTMSPVSGASFQPSSRPSQPPTPQSTGSNELGGSWTFEEQFKQLYEIDDNPRRREFLDELFAFMQKRGTPINRLPIMAKQVLDLYELFNLVVARGGLVEVINKKQWQEIIKGLGLPSSITSAAFTLRTQYTKYLYPMEMTTKGLSTQSDLQNAIDGNRREGRRMDGPFGGGMSPMTQSSMAQNSQMSSMPPMPHLPHLSPQPKHPSLSPSSQPEHLGALEMTRLALWKLYNQGQHTGLPPLMPNLTNFPSLPNLPSLPTLPNLDMFANQEKALNLQVKQQQEQLEQDKNMQYQREEEHKIREQEQRAREEQVKERLASLDQEQENSTGYSSPPPAKRAKTSPLTPSNRTNLSMTSREEEDGTNSMQISMEVNGIMYTGVLYARPS